MKSSRQTVFQKRILLADADAQTLSAFRDAMGEHWQIIAVPDGKAALAEMEKEAADVVVADLDLAEVDGAELLNRIQTNYPKAIRFVLARETDRERMVKQVLGAHQFIGKPLDTGTLKNIVEGACALENWVPKNSIRELVRRTRTLPTIPTLHLEVQALLKSPDTTTDQVGAVIAKDMAMMTKLLQVINSAWFGASRKITDPAEAVGMLGFETVSSMVMAIKLMSQYDKVKPVYFSIDKLWRHSTEVARNAKQITLSHTDDAVLAEAAFTGGLLHDLGKVVLASNFDEQYRGAQSLAAKQKLPAWEVEKEIFGASHGEIGAYLLGLWGMPLDVLEVAALHHNPSASGDTEFAPLTAVHVANALFFEKHPDKEGMVAPTIDEEYLKSVGVLEHLDVWREMVLKGDFTKPAAKPKPTATTVSTPAVPKPSPAPTPAKPAVAGKSEETAKSSFPSLWVYAGVGAVVVILLGWLGVHALTQPKEIAQASAPEPSAAQPAATAAPAPQPHAKLDAPSAQSAASEHSAPPSVAQAAATAPHSVSMAASETPPPMAATPAPTKPVVTEQVFKLQGIFFSSARPSAIINGKLVYAHDLVDGGQVVEIKASSVTLDYHKQRKTLQLK